MIPFTPNPADKSGGAHHDNHHFQRMIAQKEHTAIRDFTSQTLASFLSDLVGVALVGATPLHLLSQTVLPLKSPTGAFIAALRFANAVPPQTLLKVKTTG